MAILDNPFPMTNCREFEPLPIGEGEGSYYVFFPKACSVDWLVVDVTKVKFEDGSEWEPPGRFFPVK